MAWIRVWQRVHGTPSKSHSSQAYAKVSGLSPHGVPIKTSFINQTQKNNNIKINNIKANPMNLILACGVHVHAYVRVVSAK